MDFIEIPHAPEFQKNSEMTLEMETLDLKVEAEYPDNWLKTDPMKLSKFPQLMRQTKFSRLNLLHGRFVVISKPSLDSKGIPIAFVHRLLAWWIMISKVRDTTRARL